MRLLESIVRGWQVSLERVESRPGWDAGNPLHWRVRIEAGRGLYWSGLFSVGGAIPDCWAREAALGTDEEWAAFVRTLRSANGLMLSLGVRRSDFARLPMHGRHTLHSAELSRMARDAYTPATVDIVAALLMDASGVEPFGTFREWVDEYGADAFAHPADALKTFEACRDAARFTRNALGPSFEACAQEVAEL